MSAPASSGLLRETDPSAPPSDAQTPFRSLIPGPEHPRIQGISNHTALSWCASRRSIPEPAWLISRLEPQNLETPYIGFRSTVGDGDNGAWEWETDNDGGAPVKEVETKMRALASVLTEGQKKRVHCGNVDSDAIRLWSNPELYVNPGGIRLDDVNNEDNVIAANAPATDAEVGTSTPVRHGIMAVLRASMSEEGYAKVWGCCLTNGFLGTLVNGRGVLNEYSYNFRVFGDVPGLEHLSPLTPATTADTTSEQKHSKKRTWALTFFGHHLCLSILFAGTRMVIGPIFAGAEPDEIDEGPHKGLRLFREQEMLGLRLMQGLPSSIRERAQLSERMGGEDVLGEARWNPFDERHLGGTRQDNRVVPYEGAPVSTFPPSARATIILLFRLFNTYYPPTALAHRVRQFESHLSTTYFAWIGGYTDADPYYYRIHSPVAFLEFDFHCGIFLTNTTPAHCHIHTVNRLPNRGDYGRALIESENK